MSSLDNQLLPELPQGWQTIPVRYLSECLDGKRIPLNVDERASRKGDYPYWGANGIVDYVDDYLFDEILVLLGEDGAPFFDKNKPVAFVVDNKIWVNNHIHVLKIKPGYDARYIAYCLNVTDYGPWIEGSTRDKLTQDKLKSILVPCPDIEKQSRVSDFLDKETTHFDALIGAKEKLLALLAEKRRSLIAAAVTRGINPKVQMKDSGIPWLGSVPEHWNIERSKWLFKERDIRSEFGDEEMLTVSHLTGVTTRAEKSVNMFMAESQEGSKICEAGDLVINTLWAWMGAMGVSPQRGIVSPAYNVYEPGDRLEKAYLDYLVRIPVFAQEVIRYSKGVWSSRLRLYPEGLYEIWFPVPPVEEQRAIAEYLRTEIAKLDALQEATDRTIALLRERRTALIAAAVTGKLDIGEKDAS